MLQQCRCQWQKGPWFSQLAAFVGIVLFVCSVYPAMVLVESYHIAGSLATLAAGAALALTGILFDADQTRRRAAVYYCFEDDTVTVLHGDREHATYARGDVSTPTAHLTSHAALQQCTVANSTDVLLWCTASADTSRWQAAVGAVH